MLLILTGEDVIKEQLGDLTCMSFPKLLPGSPSFCPSQPILARDKVLFVGEGIALVVDADGSLVATITDGDIRRAVLARVKVDDNVQSLINSRPRELQKPITAPIGAAKEDLLVLMKVTRSA